MGEQSAARIEGDRFQHLYSWYLVMQLLDDSCEFDHAYLEHPRADAADDVTLHSKPGSLGASKYYQIKWHRASSDQYTFESFTATSTQNKTSLIEKLFRTWRKLKGDGPTEIWLVSNWPAANSLGKYLRGRGHEFHDDFFVCGSGAAAAKGRRLWIQKTGATSAETTDFCRDLRLRLGFAGMTDLEEMVDDRMLRFGLKAGKAPRAIVLDLVKTLIERGGEKKRVTREQLLKIVRDHDLVAPVSEQPEVSLYVHGWTKRAFDLEPTIELDWTDYFDRDLRQVPDQQVWNSILVPELSKARRTLQNAKNGHYIDFRGKASLTTILAIGASFTEVAGFSFRAEQPTDSEINLWRSDSPPSDLVFDRTLHADNDEGDDILIALSISGSGMHDAENYFQEHRDTFSALIYAEPATGTGSSAIQSAADAVALANDAKKLLREYRTLYGAKSTHLILFAPAGFCLFLGQKLNAVGRIVAYERTANGSYQSAVNIVTG